MAGDLFEFVIDRSKWCRFRLCTEGGAKCAMGQYYSQVHGMSDAVLKIGDAPGAPGAPWMGWRVAALNDSRGRSAADREERITAVFAEHGVKCDWEGDYE